MSWDGKCLTRCVGLSGEPILVAAHLLKTTKRRKVEKRLFPKDMPEEAIAAAAAVRFADLP